MLWVLIRIAEAILMSFHNIGFYDEISKIIIKYHQIRTLFLLLELSMIPSGLMKNQDVKSTQNH